MTHLWRLVGHQLINKVMRKIFVFFILITCLSSCNKEVKYYENGEIRSILTKNLFSENELTYFYENGEKSAEGYVDENGYPIGKWRGYRKENDLFWECEYAENVCLDTVIKNIAEQDVRCYIYKWMKQYYKGEVSMDYLRVDSLWNVRIFYKKECGKGAMYAYGDVDKFDREIGRWNYYYPDGELKYSFVYKDGKEPKMPCEKIPIKITMHIEETIEDNDTVYYFRFHTYDISPTMSSVSVITWDNQDSSVDIHNHNTVGEKSEEMFPFRVNLQRSIVRNYGKENASICVFYSFRNSECDYNRNGAVIAFSIKDLELKNIHWSVDEKTGRLLIERESQ